MYEDTDTSWASQSLWQIYRDARTVELAKRSAVVKLLAIQGYVSVPTSTYAYFVYSGSPEVYIYLDHADWSADDVPALRRLAGNPYYAAAAQRQLSAMGY